MYKQEIIDGYRQIILRCRKCHGPFDHKIEGRNRGFADAFELLYENIEKIMRQPEGEAMIQAFGSLIDGRKIGHIMAGIGDGYDEGYNEALEMGKIHFQIYIKQNIFD